MSISIKITGRVRGILRDAKTGIIIRITPWSKNLVPTVGLVAIANRLGNIAAAANEGMITYGAVGTGSSTPVVGDTVMLAENFRKVLATTSVLAGSVLTTETFFASGEANAALTQFALFGEAAAAGADTGTMFEYVNFAGTVTKTVNETLTVESEITIA